MLLWSLLLFRYVYPAQTHYVPAAVWRELLQRFENRIANPEPQASFRGSLIDDNMFAIDVNEWRRLAGLLLEETRENLFHEKVQNSARSTARLARTRKRAQTRNEPQAIHA